LALSGAIRRSSFARKTFLQSRFRPKVPRGTLLAMTCRQQNAGGADGERLIAKLDEDKKIEYRTTNFPRIRLLNLTQRSFEMTSRPRQRPASAPLLDRAAGFFSLVAGLLLLSATAFGADRSAAPAATPIGKVNINQASASQIAMLPRIGAKVATRVLDYRKAHGPFAKPENLMEVKGIGEKLFLTLKPYLAVSGPTTLAAKVRLGSSRRKGAPSPAAKAAPKSAPASVPAGKGR